MTEAAPPAPRRALRVLHLAHVRWFNAEAQYALDLAVEMQRRGHGVAYLTQSGSPAGRRAREAGVVTGEEAGFNAQGVGALRVLGASLRLRALLRVGRYDAVE
ncbi:MAG: hypothetical protein HGA98_05535, partial [Deltaproteobacteria bacterium]|nr:hypothetical protein [Deltaproteobacteria bacterium]